MPVQLKTDHDPAADLVMPDAYMLWALKAAEETIGKPVFWQIPNDFPATISAINQKKPLSQIKTRTGICESFKGLTHLFLEKERQEKEL